MIISIESMTNISLNLGRIDIFTTLSLPIQDHGTSLYLFQFIFVSFMYVS